MIQESYCSFEIAKLLKEKGFDEYCDKYYPIKGGEVEELTLDELNYHRSQFIKSPTHQMACAWLREKGFHVNACISYDTSEDADGNECDEWTFWFFEILSSFSGRLVYTKETEEYDTYEEACEAAIKYCLENLI